MKILLTGGSGFIGRNILESNLAKKYQLIAPRHAELDLVDDVAVAEYFSKNKFDVVIHAAIKPGHRNASDLNDLFYTHCRMFFNLAKHSGRYGRLINLSSGCAYDMHRRDLDKVAEESFGEVIPEDEHGFFRYIAGKHIESMDNAVDLRIFSIFGKYEEYAIRFISNAICKAIYDLPITIKQNRKFDFLFVEDLIPVLDYFIEHKPNFKSYNVTPDKSIELYEVAEKIRKIYGKDLPIAVKKEGMEHSYSGSNERLRQEISGLKLTSIDDAMKKLYDWYSTNKKSINKELLLVDK
mgnify:CR=1 FL=1